MEWRRDKRDREVERMTIWALMKTDHIQSITITKQTIFVFVFVFSIYTNYLFIFYTRVKRSFLWHLCCVWITRTSDKIWRIIFTIWLRSKMCVRACVHVCECDLFNLSSVFSLFLELLFTFFFIWIFNS